MKTHADVEAVSILILTGSARRPSHTAALASTAKKFLTLRGALATVWDPMIKPLPMPNPRFHHNPQDHPDPAIRELVSIADAVDGFVIASPVYHNSYSSVVKVVLDHLAIPQFRYKPVGLVSHGEFRNTRAVDHLRIVARGLQGVVIPAQVCSSDEDYEQTEDGYALNNPMLLTRMERFSSELTLFAVCLRLLRRTADSG